MNLIYDRTSADVVNKTAKGSYNYTDLNRVEGAVAEIVQKLAQAGTTITVVTKTDWAVDDIPLLSDMERYLNNIKAISEALNITAVNFPSSMRLLDYKGANALEKVLHEADLYVNNSLASAVHSGEIYSAEAIGYLREAI